ECDTQRAIVIRPEAAASTATAIIASQATEPSSAKEWATEATAITACGVPADATAPLAESDNPAVPTVCLVSNHRYAFHNHCTLIENRAPHPRTAATPIAVATLGEAVLECQVSQG